MNKKKFLYNTSIVLIIFSFNKILGFFRETLIATKYGATTASDSFYFALSIAGLLFIISGSFSQIIKPIIIKKQKEKGILEGEIFFNRMSNFISLILIVMCIVLIIFAKQVISIFGYGFSQAEMNLTITLFRIALISSYSIGMATIFASYFDCRRMFISSAFDAYFFNIITISFLFIFANEQNIILFAYIYAFGEFFRLVYFGVILKRKKYHSNFLDIGIKDKDVRKTAKLAVPILAGSLSGVFNRLVDRILASTLTTGSIASLNYADKLTSVFTGLILSAIMKVVFPSLTEISLSNKEEYRKKAASILNYTLFLVIPVVTAFIVFAKILVIVVYEHGIFTRTNTIMVAEIVVIYAMSMFFSSLNLTMGKFFYINKQTKIILISGLLGFAVNISFNLILIQQYQHKGLAYATLLASFIRTLYMLYIMHFKNKMLLIKENLKCLFKCSFASLIMISGAYGVSKLLYNYMFRGVIINEILGLIIIATTGVILYVSTLYIMKSKELNYFLPARFKNIEEK